jgi:hypothetical protein
MISSNIKNRFEFLDLDKNSLIGAAELRHILVGMDELVSDEEIDMMIRMLDTNGDGFITVDEFIAMVTHPDPSSEDFQPRGNSHLGEEQGEGSSAVSKSNPFTISLSDSKLTGESHTVLPDFNFPPDEASEYFKSQEPIQQVKMDHPTMVDDFLPPPQKCPVTYHQSPSWLISMIRKIISAPIPTLEDAPFIFELTADAANHNMR